MSAFYVMLIPAAFLLIFEDKNVLKKVISGLSIVLMIISTLLGASRGALLFASLNILISLMFVKIQPKKIFIGLAAFAAIAIVANYVLGQFLTTFLERAIREMTKKGMESPREAIWKATIPMIKDHLLGVGIASENYSTQLMKYGNMDWASAHNIYFDFLARTGLPGFISIVTIFISCLVTLIVTYLRNKEHEIRLVIACLIMMLLGFLIMGFTEPIFVNQYKLNYIFATLLGVSMSMSVKYGKREK
jgi:O-antigen ligase